MDWGFEIAFFVIFTLCFIVVAYLYEQWKKGVQAKNSGVEEISKNRIHVKCECGYEYEGESSLCPIKCPQCGKGLYSP